MTEQHSADLAAAISSCAAEMQRSLIVKTGINRVQAIKEDRRQWRGPPLRPNGEYAGVKLNTLPFYLYAEGGHDPSVWEELLEIVRDGGDVLKVAKERFPSLPFTSPAPPIATLVQVLCAMWWHGGDLEVTRLSAFLDRGKVRRGFSRRVILGDGTQARFGVGRPVNPQTYLSVPMGRNRYSGSPLAALYRHLCAQFPDNADAFDVIFSTAVTAGPEYQMLLTEQFDIVTVTDKVPDGSDLWALARRVINTSTRNPRMALWKVLKSRLTVAAFTSRFGNPYREPGEAYSLTLRSEHNAALDEIESHEIDSVIFNKVGDPAKAALDLMKLQMMMGTKA